MFTVHCAIQSAVPAFGDLQRYEIIDLGALCGWPDATEYRAWAMNDGNIVVGSAYRPDTGLQHAFVWSFCPKYTLGAKVMRDLTTARGLAGNGAAFDINESDVIVGEQVVAPWLAPRGYVWNLPSIQVPTDPCPPGTMTGYVLSALTTSVNFGAYARSINDASPALVVGTSYTALQPCLQGADPPLRGFRYRIGDPTTAITTLLPLAGDDQSVARGVSTQATAQIGGFSEKGCQLFSCDDDFNALQWTDGFPLAPVTLGTASGSTQFGAIVERLNNVGMSAGNAKSNTWQCVPHAAFWGSGGALTDLGSVTVDAAFDSFGFGIAPTIASGPVDVVGSTLKGIGDAVLWSRRNLVWSGTLLTPTTRECGSTWELRQARDVNGSGMIVGWGIKTTNGVSRTRAFLLRPICPGDLTGDCVVGAADLGAFGGAWGAATCSGSLPTYAFSADFDGSGVVDGADMGILIGTLWGSTCSGVACTGIVCGQGNQMMAGDSQNAAADVTGMSFEIDEITLATAAGAIGFDSLAALAAWSTQASDEEMEGAVEALRAIAGAMAGSNQ